MTKLRAEATEKDSGAKHVSFPPDEEIVSGFAEFADRQRTDGRFTVADIVSAYEQSCVKHQVEPNRKALEQVKLVATPGTRTGCLDLRGERLDYHSCESLEEILKFVQFDSINLEDAELQENGAASLLEMILYYESACQLNVSANALGTTGWAALSHLARQSSCLWRLDACSMPLVEFPAQALSKALVSSRLRVLHLEKASLSGRPLFTLASGVYLIFWGRSAAPRASPWGAQLLIIAIDLWGPDCGSSLRRTVDSPKSIQRSPHLVPTVPDGSVAIPGAAHSGLIKSDTLISGDSMGTLKKNAVLEELGLGDNDLNSYQDSMQLGELLKNNRSLRSLDLSHNLIGDGGLEEICEGLMSQQSGLKSLVLLNNQITHAGMQSMANVLPHLKTLENVKLDQNKVQNEGIHILKESLMRNRSILSLGLADTHITCEGAVALAEFIAESPQIRHVDARRNAILCGGLMAVSLALRINVSLVALDLDPTAKPEQGPGKHGGTT
ncbi:hypothetical protein ACEWY4_005013 [Coilia grayii]|uniref:Protein phosphatase 1 regulatory subunit 37 n=1 Tax=Coilia grayii TaxID=363190 RepID=A0ABD1KHA4_9TELE